MHNKHVWTKRSKNGVKREVRAIKNRGAWRFQSKGANEERWAYYDKPELEDLVEFRDILFRKYQRRRASYEDVQWADEELMRRGRTK